MMMMTMKLLICSTATHHVDDAISDIVGVPNTNQSDENGTAVFVPVVSESSSHFDQQRWTAPDPVDEMIMELQQQENLFALTRNSVVVDDDKDWTLLHAPLGPGPTQDDLALGRCLDSMMKNPLFQC